MTRVHTENSFCLTKKQEEVGKLWKKQAELETNYTNKVSNRTELEQNY